VLEVVRFFVDVIVVPHAELWTPTLQEKNSVTGKMNVSSFSVYNLRNDDIIVSDS